MTKRGPRTEEILSISVELDAQGVVLVLDTTKRVMEIPLSEGARNRLRAMVEFGG
jgi:hypothetical protein